MAANPGGPEARRSQQFAVLLTMLVGVGATAMAYLGTRESPRGPVSAPESSTAATAEATQAIAFPHDEPHWPPGPHQRTFITSCTVCHSTRLVMTQPSFPRQKWIDIVRKMVKTYGAPISPQVEGEVVDYLMTVRGK